MDKKNTMLLTVIAVATLLVAVVGATFAYFSITSNTSTTPTTVTGTTEDVGTVALSNPTSALKIDLSAVDMSVANKGTNYYATDSATDKFDTTANARSVAKATVTGGTAATKYKCTAKLTLKASGTMTVADAGETSDQPRIVTGDGKVTLSAGTGATVDTTEIDLKELVDAGATGKVVNVTYQLTGPSNADVNAVFQLNNTDAVQNNIAGKTVTVEIANSDFSCDTVADFD